MRINRVQTLTVHHTAFSKSMKAHVQRPDNSARIRTSKRPLFMSLHFAAFFVALSCAGLSAADIAFQAAEKIYLPSAFGISSIAAEAMQVADFNEDGFPDLIVLGRNPQTNNPMLRYLLRLLNDGQGNLASPLVIPVSPSSQFSSSPSYGLHSGMSSSGLVDFNNDGHVDVLVAQGGSSGSFASFSLLVYLGDGSGGLSSPVVSTIPFPVITSGPPIGPFPWLATGDFDEDGNLDALASVPLSGGIDEPPYTLFQGNGLGALTATSGHSNVTYLNARHLLLLDLNIDGHIDIVQIPYINETTTRIVHVLYSDGSGIITACFGPIPGLCLGESSFTIPQLNGGPLSIAAADFNEDGIPDIVHSDTRGVSVHIGTGALNPPADQTWHFLPEQRFAIDDDCAPNSSSISHAMTIAGDFNGDGHTDLVGVNAQGGAEFQVYFGDGTGSLTFNATYYANHLSSVNWIASADLNQDGRDELLILPTYFGGYTSIEIWRNDAPGVFRTAVPAGFPRPYINTWNIAYNAQFPVLDINEDGNLDILANDYGPPTEFQISFGTGGGHFANPTPKGFIAGPNDAVDFNGDGHLDLLSLGPTGLLLQAGDGNGDFTANSACAYPPNTSFSITHSKCDYNNDGNIDLIALGLTSVEPPSPQVLAVLPGDGLGHFALQISGHEASYIVKACWDFNGDGNTDVIAAPPSSSMSYFAGNGNGTFQAGIPLPTSNAGPWWPFDRLVDFNGDCIDDLLGLVTGNPAGSPWSLVVMYGDPSGSFQTPAVTQTIPNPLLAQSLFRQMNGLGDMDLDGNLDLVIQGGYSYDFVEIWRGDGTGGFSHDGRLFAPAEGTNLNNYLLGDLDGDGLLDILSDVNTNTCVETTGVGNATVLANRTAVVPPSYTDCNGNHRADHLDIALGASRDCDRNGVPDECVATDNCPLVDNPLQDDVDGDGNGDVCDPCPGDAADGCDAAGSAAIEMLASIGGGFTSPNGRAEVTIAAGALSTDSTISVTSELISSPTQIDVYYSGQYGPGRAIAIHDLRPDGTTFALPTIVRLTPDASALTETERNGLTVFEWSTSLSRWVPLDLDLCSASEFPQGVFTADCTVQLAHFSRYAVAASTIVPTIPAASTWGLIALLFMLLTAGTLVLHRSRIAPDTA